MGQTRSPSCQVIRPWGCVGPNSIFSQFAQKCHPNEQQHRFPSFIHSVFSEDTLSKRHCSRYWKRCKDETMPSRETEHVHKYEVKEDRRSKNELSGEGLGYKMSLLLTLTISFSFLSLN